MAVYLALGMSGAALIARASLAAGESGALSVGTPITVTRYPVQGDSTDDHKVKVCADGAIPDAVVVAALDETTAGKLCYLNNDRIPLRLGGAVARNDLLKVSGGKFVKCMTGDVGVAASNVTGAANDIVNGYGLKPGVTAP